MAPVKKEKKLFSADHRLISATDANQQKKPLGSVMTSFGKRRSVRVAMKTNGILRKIWICADVWLDILPFFDHPQLGLKLALISPRFEVLVDKHFGGKPELTISRRVIIRKMGTKTNESAVMKSKPMPDHPLNNKIRFQNLWIDYIDHSVIKFLHANQQIFDKGINLDLQVPYARNAKNARPIWNDFAREVWPIFAPTIRHLSFYYGYYLDNLRRHISPTILTDLNALNSIYSNYVFPASIAYDGPNATGGQALFKWLNTPTEDGKPKQLSCRHAYDQTSQTKRLIKSFKKKFLRANTSSACYLIRLELFETTEIEPFEVMNERTNEMLTLEKDDNVNYGNAIVHFVLKRWQIGRTIQWEDNKTKNNLNNVRFTVNEFGPLSPPKAGQMNAKDPLLMEMNAGPSGEQKKK